MTDLRILCCSSVTFGSEIFSAFGATRVLDATHITRAELLETDVLIIRSTTRVDESLLKGTPVRFVGTATAGTDHIDIPYLDANNIAWASAPGSNANSVAEYVMSALLLLHRRNGLALDKKTLGIIGVGHVGRRVASLAPALGLKVLLCDPPLATALDLKKKSHHYISQAELIEKSDIITLHVPLIQDGPHPTHHLANDVFLRSLRQNTTLINAARGPVLETDALRRAYKGGYAPRHLILDTWEPEPALPWDILEHVDLATPHIAGYSIDGKAAGTFQIMRAFCQALERPVQDSSQLQLPAPSVPEMVLTQKYHSDTDALSRIVPVIHGIEEADRRLRSLSPELRHDEKQRAAHFRAQRKSYPKRREFKGTLVRVPATSPSLASRLRLLGFNVQAFT